MAEPEDNPDEQTLLKAMVIAKKPATLQNKVVKPNFTSKMARENKEAAESRDPVAGKKYRDDKKVQITVYVTAEMHRDIKLLAIMENKRANDYYATAMDEFYQKIRDRIPKIDQ